jgi:plastocyanin
MRTLILAAAVAALAAAPATAATRTVRIDDNYFVRSDRVPTVTVGKGTVVKWRWYGSRRHNVVVERGPVTFRSEKKRSGRFKRTMRVRGTYRIICEVHEPSMRMKLVVE